MKTFLPGDRVKVYDYTLFKDDIDTPVAALTLPATVVCWYGGLKRIYCGGDLVLGPYPSLLDVVFDHRPEQVSHGHFTDFVEYLPA